MPSGGRFGYKCIPPHTTCEIYHNQSGAEASVSYATQVIYENEVTKTHTAVVGVSTCLTCTESLYDVTDGAKNLVGVHNRGTYQGAFFRGRLDNDTASTRIGRYHIPATAALNPDTEFTNTANFETTGESRMPDFKAPYGGNEVILPGSTDLYTISECNPEKVPYCIAAVTWSCDGMCPYFVTSVHVDCKDCFASKRFVNVYENANAGPYAFEESVAGYQSIEASTLTLFECVKNERLSYEAASTPLCHWVVNHYGTAVTGDRSTVLTTCQIARTCTTEQRSQAVIMGLDTGGTSYNWMGWSCTLNTCYNPSYCCPLQTSLNYIGVSKCGFGTFWYNLCCLIGGGDPSIATETSVNKTLWCCNTQGSTVMSPYGVQRAATYGVVTWAFCNSDQGTGYYFGYPRGCMPWGTVGGVNHSAACCCGLGVWVNVPQMQCCEYPMKYLSHDPNTCRTYTMMRSCQVDSCGIFEVDYDALYNLTQTNCQQITGNCAAIVPLPSMTWTGIQYNSGSSQWFRKVADFPKEMTSPEYESPVETGATAGQMCVSCIYKYGPSHWALQVYNHTNSDWDTFYSTNLYDWDKEDNLLLNISDDVKVYKLNDSCIVNYTDQFDQNIDKAEIIDYSVISNAYERSGIVISNGDRIVIKNDGNYPIAAQVWGFEG